MAVTESSLENWTAPASASEEEKLGNAERMIKEAIRNDPKLSKFQYDIFGQGSYANDTNVRLNSDVDINVRLSSTFFVDIPKGKKFEDYGYSDASYSFREYKHDVYNALVKHFGVSEVESKDKCIEIRGNTYRVKADVVPTLKLIRHDDNGSRHEGSQFISDSNVTHTNYALQHIENGKKKNARTGYRYKKLVRIVKRIRYKMIEEGKVVNPNITSFLIESLIWNVPDEVLNNHDTWFERLKAAILHIYSATNNEDSCKDWGEVSELLYLFRPSRKWRYTDVNEFMSQLWNYL